MLDREHAEAAAKAVPSSHLQEQGEHAREMAERDPRQAANSGCVLGHHSRARRRRRRLSDNGALVCRDRCRIRTWINPGPLAVWAAALTVHSSQGRVPARPGSYIRRRRQLDGT